MSASMLARHGAGRRPPYMSESRSARDHRDGDPGKTTDSLTDDHRSRRVCIHVVDGNEDIVSIVVADPERHHIVAKRRGAEQQSQQKTEDDGRLTQFTHTPSQFHYEPTFLLRTVGWIDAIARRCRRSGRRLRLKSPCCAAPPASSLRLSLRLKRPRTTVETPAEAGDIDRQRVRARLAANISDGSVAGRS
jgi:hypothetical protein